MKANFADIEREAELADQLKLQEKIPVEPEKTPEEQEAQVRVNPLYRKSYCQIVKLNVIYFALLKYTIVSFKICFR